MSLPDTAFTELHTTLLKRGQRMLVWWNIDPASQQEDPLEQPDMLWRTLFHAYPHGRITVCTPNDPTASETEAEEGAYAAHLSWVEPGQSRRYLGQECDVVVMDMRADFDPDAFGILTGTIAAGGICLLVTTPTTFSTRYGARLLRLLSQSQNVARFDGDTLVVPPLPEASDWAHVVDEWGCLTPDQHQAVAAVASLKRRRPLVLTADRGRGKSAALAIGASHLLKEKGGEIHVTAPSMETLGAFFQQLQNHLPEGQQQGHRFVHPSGCVIYQDPLSLVDAFSSAAPPGGDGSIMLVDEAAALPTHLLVKCLERFPRIAFATTTHGYEGSGRGFAVRFRRYLDEQTPDWLALSLETPVRWALGDPLEACVAQLLCLDAEPDDIQPMFNEVRVERLDRDRLVKSENSIKSLFGLLVLAHYRTTPNDLKRLLDQRGITLWIATGNHQLLGVCVSADEGGYQSPLAEEVTRGERRLPGELLPQSLALHEGIRAAAEVRWRRIMRIVVHPAVQRRGVGRKLIDTIAYYAASKGVAMLGASYGAVPDLISFWSSLACQPLRLGLKPERASGENALMVGRALNAEGAAVFRHCRTSMLAALEDRLPLELKGLDPVVVNELMQPAPIPRTDELEMALRRLGEAHAPLIPYRSLLKQHWGGLRSSLDREAQQGMVALLYQGHDERWLARRFGQAGRAAGEALWREWCRQMRVQKIPE